MARSRRVATMAAKLSVNECTAKWSDQNEGTQANAFTNAEQNWM